MLPLAELHLHIEGTLEADLLVRLARRNGVPLPSENPAELTTRYADFADLQAFLDVYYANLAVLRTEEDFRDLAAAYLSRAAAAGVRRAEIFCDPQTHLGNGVPLEVVFGGLGAALEEARAAGLSADLIVCFLRDLGGEAAEDLLRRALPFRQHFIGVGLDSAEVGWPPRLFAKAYAMAAAEGLHRVAHAGEEGGPEYVREALDVLGVERIDHGNRALEDPDLVARLRDERVPLTVCPLSNVALKGVPRIEAHPLPRMLELGLVVTVNSDDPAYFGGGIDANVRALRSALGMTDDDLATLAANSFEAAFIDEPERARWTAEVRAWAADHGAGAPPD
jgi:adenosine deaminase